MSRVRFAYALAAAIAIFPVAASAHAFGQQYTLPLPFSLYALGAMCALIASFVFLGLYSTPSPSGARRQTLQKTFSIPQYFEIVLRVIGIILFGATLTVAFFGSQDFTQNPAPILFWIGLLLGMTYLHVVIGGIWRLLNPFETIARVLFLSSSRVFFQYPSWLGYVPALVVYYCLIWLELLSNGAGALPATIGTTLIMYLNISMIGAVLFGTEDWFMYGDFLNVFFGLIGRFAPLQLESGFVRLQLPAEQFVSESPKRMSLLLFILFMLSSTAFDGLQDTQVWRNILYQSVLQTNFYTLEKHIVLIASPFIFLALYGSAMYLMQILTQSTQSYRALLLRFAYSLIPIAIAYNFAHYFTLLSNEGQALIPLLSDPFAKGWNLFGAAGYRINIGLIGAQTVWYVQFGAILLGHIIATYVAHRIALREFPTRWQVLVGQLPILILMIFYTVFGLWILSQAFQNGLR